MNPFESPNLRNVLCPKHGATMRLESIRVHFSQEIRMGEHETEWTTPKFRLYYECKQCKMSFMDRNPSRHEAKDVFLSPHWARAIEGLFPRQ